MITIGEFIKILISEEPQTGDGFDEILKDARKAGWIEEQDILGRDEELDRRTAARILHMYRKQVLGISDVPDISAAYYVKDLFDCRVCANHIAQIILQGVMEPVKVGDMVIFDVYKTLTDKEARDYISKAEMC